MNEILKNIIEKVGLETFVISFIVTLGIVLIYLRVFKNFKQAKLQKDQRKKEIKSVVETTSMTCFFILCYVIVITGLGSFTFSNIYINILALIVYIIGTVFNLLGRKYLGANWGNNVVIYTNHTLVTDGVYKVVRHPLYASIIWMIYAVGILYKNYLVIILNTIIFIPFMTYRAKQEEKELEKIFEEYKNYKKRVGMFFPKILKRR
ncbi:MAG: isoprenylcysteine carboxylmethyltransferase family protein [Clostridia bacterium]|nr:isoprenylcysteine carboxylmethyltransferase family protein [Clostridia bacterium]